jgi:fructose-1,6-bisphosphatase I
MDSSTEFTTLPDFIRQQEKEHPKATGDLTNVLLSIALGVKVLAKAVQSAGLDSLYGLSGGQNVHGENVQKLDLYADNIFTQILGRSGEFVSMVSEEQENVFTIKDKSAHSKYVVAFDPVDGSSNIDVNVAIGTIWGVYVGDFFQPGKNQVAAGYTVYGASTMFVYTTGSGTNGFTLDSTIGEFILTHPNIKIPENASTYSCNEGNYMSWSPGIRAYIDYAKSKTEDKKPFSQRYVGSLVADVHRTLLKGGIFFYPGDDKNPSGKLRYLYECAPIAFVVEQAGGRSSDGKDSILNRAAKQIHERSPLIVGSSRMVEELENYIKDLG